MNHLLALVLLFNFALGHYHFDFGDDNDLHCDSDSESHELPGPDPFQDLKPFPNPEHFPIPGTFPGPESLPGLAFFPGPGWGHPWHHQESDFDKLARFVISADKQVYNNCKQSSYSRVRVMLDENMYTLKYNLPEFAESGIKVQIKHRVISATAEAQGVPTFRDLRIIPEFVKVPDASLFFQNGTLTVLMPYKSPVKTEVALDCTSNINESVIDVAKINISEDDLRNMD